ncbi:MAG: hypothetical protein KDD53_03445, partial [Bdellovibrionales bacterium]|nr:hypothetical protein [Bdellovibrionales bacterium]
DQVVVPNFVTLKELEFKAMRFGLKSRAVLKYLTEAFKFALPALPASDRDFMHLISKMISKRKNPADGMLEFLRQQGITAQRLSPKESALANRYMRSLYVSGITPPTQQAA